MKVFCPNCGAENNGMPGGRLTCQACTASFEVPRESGWVAPPPPLVVEPPKQPAVAPIAPPPAPLSGGYQGPPPAGFTRGNQSLPINQLAIASFVLGILCCIPFSGIGAIVTGIIARQQIADSNGTQRGNEYALIGMVLGALAVLVSMASIVLNALTHH